VTNRKGFTLIESLLSLVFFLMIILSSLEFFGTTRKIFFRLKEAQETSAGAAAALEKIRIDLLHAGRGLAQPISLGIIDGIELQNEALGLIIGEKAYTLTSDLSSGQAAVPLPDTEGLHAGREVCIFDGRRGEVLGIESVDKGMMRLAPPPANSYLRQDGKIVLLQKVSFYLERGSSILRRKVNASPAQPLVEGVRFFGFSYDGRSNLAQVQIGFEKEPEKTHEISVLLKNVALGKSHEM
jgi:type II secretory pathway pseudopilin PulG